MHGHEDEVTCIAFCSNDEMTVTGSVESSIIRSETVSGK